jgi:hypothetical protein
MTRAARLLFGALLIAALIPAASATAAKPAPVIKGTWTRYLPERVHGISVAIAPDGTPFFGLSVGERPPSIASVESRKLKVAPLRNEGTGEETTALQFSSQGALWFARNDDESNAIARRDPGGLVTNSKFRPANP